MARGKAWGAQRGLPLRNVVVLVLVLALVLEHEAQREASQVLARLQRGERPVALIAQDRVLVRRVRALVERHGVHLLDETGWKLSTTRAAELVMSLLKAARPDASADDLFDVKRLPRGWLYWRLLWKVRAQWAS